MTLVHFHLTDAEGRGLDGSVSLVPTRRVTVADAIRLPVAQTVRLTAGEAHGGGDALDDPVGVEGV